MERRRQDTAPQRHHHLDHTRRAGRGLGVPDVGLDRAEPQRAVTRTVLTVRCQQCLRFNRIAQFGTGAVRLHRIDVIGSQARIRQRLPDHALLRRAVGRGQVAACAVLVDRRSPNQRQDRMLVAPGVGQPLQHEKAHAFGEPGSIGTGGERLASTVPRKCSLAAEDRERYGGGHRGNAPRKREGALALPKRLYRQVERHQ